MASLILPSSRAATAAFNACTVADKPLMAPEISIMSAPLGDGCLRTTIVARERAGTPCARHYHSPCAQRRPRAGISSSLTTERATVQRINSEPDCHANSSLETNTDRVRCPESMSVFCAIAVCVLRWKGCGLARRTDGVERGVFMPSIEIFLPKKVFANASEKFASVRKE